MNTIGLDIGTSSVKALLVSASGEVLKVSAPEYPFQTPKPLWAETDPTVWWNATKESIRQLLDGQEAKNVGGIGLTGQMHGMVALDASGEVLRPCIMWNDQRSFAECEEMTSLIGKEQVLKITGNPILAGFTAPKILWVQKNEPDVFSSIDKILLPKDFIRYKLSGEFFSDVSDASGMSLLNVGNREWSSDILDVLGWKREWLPEVTESTEVSAKLSSTAADLTGLPAGIPIVAGGGDCAAQAVGSSIVEEGKVSVTLGTSGVVFAQSDEYRVEPQGKLHSFCHAVPGKWHMMGVNLCAGGSLQWFAETLCKELGDKVYDVLNREAARATPGSEGLFFLPYLAGERTPHADPDARGCFVGLTLAHQRGQIARAIMEGVTYSMRDSLEIIQGMNVPVKQVRVSGGGSRSKLWRQLQADVFGTKAVTINAEQGPAYGVALLAAVGAGAYKNIQQACSATIRETSATPVDRKTKRVYDARFPTYQNLYQSLKGDFKSISAIES